MNIHPYTPSTEELEEFEELENTTAMEMLHQMLSTTNYVEMKTVINAVDYFMEDIEEKRISSLKCTEYGAEPNFIGEDRLHSNTNGNNGDRIKRSMQNKRASTKYRNKKREERRKIEVSRIEQKKLNHNIRLRLRRLQNEFSVVFALAENSFIGDQSRQLSLESLRFRVMKDKLLE